jgi:hypothetical protein
VRGTGEGKFPLPELALGTFKRAVRCCDNAHVWHAWFYEESDREAAENLGTGARADARSLESGGCGCVYWCVA